jgi:enterochelin esterase-like enzyme
MKQLLLLVAMLLGMQPLCAQSKEGPLHTERIPIYKGDTLIRHHFEAFGELPGRWVDVWLPKNGLGQAPLALVLAQDGQNIFDPSTAYGGQSWELHLAVQKLLDSQQIRPCMVVGIWNSPNRFNEYLPSVAVAGLDSASRAILQAERMAAPQSDLYVAWIDQVLLPFLTSAYPIATQAADRFLIGSSMGGLISSYLLARLPQQFGGAMCLSTHWPLSLKVNELAFSAPYRSWLLAQAPVLQHKRLYMDHGDLTLDSFYAIHQQAFDAAWQSQTAFPANYRSLAFEQAAHNEASWRERLHIPLLFMLAK